MSEAEKKIQQRAMFGCDIDEFLKSVVESVTFRMTGANMVVAGLMSDAQELMEMGFIDDARQTLNRAKYVLLKVSAGDLPGTGTARATFEFQG